MEVVSDLSCPEDRLAFLGSQDLQGRREKKEPLALQVFQ